MRIKFLAVFSAPKNYVIDGETINGIDLSLQDEDRHVAGIYNVERDEHGVLHATLSQATLPYQIPTHHSGWAESDWIDSESYLPDTCYVRPTSIPDGVEYELGWHKEIIDTPAGAITREGWTVFPVNNTT